MNLMDLFLYVRLELCCLAVITYIAYSFFSVKRIKNYVHKLFSIIIISSIINIIFDIITVYTVNNLTTVPNILNHIFHIIFVGSVAAIIFCTYLYVRALIYPDQKPKFIFWIPFALAIFSIICLPIKYNEGSHTNYSAGPAVTVAYICIIFYFVLSFTLLLKFHSQIGKKQLRGIVTAIISIITVSSLQFFLHESLVSSIGIVMLNIAFFFTVENPDEALIEELEYAKDKANAANKAKSQFLANMSHEIRTPINAMLGMDEMILRETRDGTILDYASKIKTAGNTLLSLINDILDFSKIEEGKVEISPVNYDISTLILDVVNMMSVKAKEKGLVLILHADESIPKSLYGDPIRIKQCILNLVSNAIKYTDHGNVTFSINHIKLDEKNINLTITVKDTGKGIKKEEISRVGLPFERLEQANYLPDAGAGLGINIVNQILNLMDTDLELYSEYGKGTEFKFTIKQEVKDWKPIGGIEENYKKSLTKIVRYKEKVYAPNAKLLFVDDTPMNLDVIKGLLKTTGVQIDTASSGTEAIDLVCKNEYDILFIDHKMPEPDGIQTLHLMENNENNKNKGKPCIVLTANAIAGVKEMYLEEGFTDYLSKPVNPEKLEEMIAQYLPAYLIEKKTAITESKKQANELKIEGIDLEAALTNSGSEKNMEAAMLQFKNSIKENANELQTLLDTGDIKTYGIKVHALKSMARIIGAKVLSNQAEFLEDAAGKNDVEAIKKNHPALIQNYKSYIEKLKVFDKTQNVQDSKAKEKLTEAEIQAFTKELLKLIENFDSQGIDNLVEETKKKNIPDPFSEKFTKICTLAEKIDYDALKELLV